jgi:NAD(P) transhydrogenase subunit alpha
MAPTDLASGGAVHASQMFSRNVATLMQHLVKDGRLTIDLADEITGAMTVAHDGAVRAPGPTPAAPPPAVPPPTAPAASAPAARA